MTPVRVGYRAYLLRLWGAPQAGWRVSLEDAHSGERRAFATLVLLVAFLEQQIDDLGPGGPTPSADLGPESTTSGSDAPDEFSIDGGNSYGA